MSPHTCFVLHAGRFGRVPVAMRRRSSRATRKNVSVLFLQSSTNFLADSQVHAALARELPQIGCAVFVAGNPGRNAEPSPSITAFRAIPDITVRTARFGPDVDRRGKVAALKALSLGVPSVVGSTISLALFARRNHIDVIHCSEKVREAVIGFVVARLSGAKLVIHLHLKVEHWFGTPTKWIMHRADHLLAISEFVALSAVAMGYAPSRISTALNGLTRPVEDFYSGVGDREWIVDQFDVPADAVLICIAARINRWKGHQRLIESLASIDASSRPFFLIVAGRDDPNETAPEYTIAAFEALAARRCLGDRVLFAGFRDDAHRIIRSCDVFAMPSFEEPFGLVYIEAMAAAKPVVALNDGGTPEVVLDGVTGLLSDVNDQAALAHHLVVLLDDAALRSRLGAEGRARALTHFTARRMATDVLAVYRSLSSAASG